MVLFSWLCWCFLFFICESWSASSLFRFFPALCCNTSSSLVGVSFSSSLLLWVSVFRRGIPRFLFHIAVMCVFLPRQLFGGRDLVKLVAVLVAFCSSRSSSLVLLHVLMLRVRRLLHICFHIACVAMSASLVHILVSLLHFPLIPWVVFVGRMYGSSFRVLLLLFRFLLLRFLLFLVLYGLSMFPVGLRIHIFDVLSS